MVAVDMIATFKLIHTYICKRGVSKQVCILHNCTYPLSSNKASVILENTGLSVNIPVIASF